jgi:prepilin-type N-terminal cleavage/methylation domain-containing protein
MPAHRSHHPRRRDAGFTISELVLVLAVFAGLLAITIVSVNGIDHDSAKSKCQTELRKLKAATEQFKAELGFYPPNDKALQDAALLDQRDTPNWSVETISDEDGPVYRTTGPRCR